MGAQIDDRCEWLEADGLGGFASGTASGIRTRRYHALLLCATTPPTGRYALVNGAETLVETPVGRFALSTQRYAPDVVHPDGAARLKTFSNEPWPTWEFECEDGTGIRHELVVPRGGHGTVMTWRLTKPRPGVRVVVRPLLSGRDYHALHRENGAFRFDALEEVSTVTWRPYRDVWAVGAAHNGRYAHAPLWYRSFLYAQEVARGFEGREDLASPGEFVFDLSSGEAALILTARAPGAPPVRLGQSAAEVTRAARALRRAERKRRENLGGPIERAADTYIVKREGGSSIIAGYPWFADWGRDTFIAMRGLCLATGRLEEARQILLQWVGHVSRGMLPNRFPDRGEEPEYNSVDASLWFVIVAQEFLDTAAKRDFVVSEHDRARLRSAMLDIVSGYAKGTRHGIAMDDDGLLRAGVPGVQLTWMDSKVGDWVVTPRIGKPVEIQALWLNALSIAANLEPRWAGVLERGLRSFRDRFWLPDAGYLADVVDDSHVPGKTDSTLRPNQTLAVGGLPLCLLSKDRARQVVDAVEARLLTPLGLRSLAPGKPEYAPRYEGGPVERDASYHQGTVWPWLIGPFVEAWLRVRGVTKENKRVARERFIEPLMAHLNEAGLGHVSEIADAEPPHTARGCPFQAWSLGELLRLERCVLANGNGRAIPRRATETPATPTVAIPTATTAAL